MDGVLIQIVQGNVATEQKHEIEYATTQHQTTVVPLVLDPHLKTEHVWFETAQVIHFHVYFIPSVHTTEEKNSSNP